MFSVGRAALRADVHAALEEPLLEHRVHVHERLDGDALDPLGDELAEARCVLPRSALAGETHERREAEVAALAHVAKELRRSTGCVSELCSLSRPSSASLTQAAQLRAQLRIVDPIGDEVRDASLSRSWPTIADERFPFAAVGAQQVADAAAVRVRARERGQVAPGDEAVGLLAEPRQHTGVGQPIHRIDRTGAPRCRTAAGSTRRRRTACPTRAG